MQPCAVCGGLQVDAAGYCTRCRTFRGVPAQQPYLVPQPQPGYGYQQQPPPANRARAFVIPLVALSVTLVVLVVAIVVVVISQNTGGGGDPVADPTSTRGTPASTLDDCVVGTWRVTSHEEDTNVPNYGKLHISGGEGTLITLRRDGTGETDYGDGTSFEASASGQRIRIEVHGRVTYRYEAKDGSVTQHDTTSDATVRLFINDERYGNETTFDASENETSSYTCASGRLTQKSLLFTTEMAKQS